MFGALLLALAITSIGWATARDDPEWERLSGCTAVDGRLNVSFDYGGNERTALVLDTRGGGGVLAVEHVEDSGDTPDIGLGGQASLIYEGAVNELRYPNGDPVDCESS